MSQATETLQARCDEIVGWRKTGILTGDVLRQFASERYGDKHDALRRAENDTIQEALERVAARRAKPSFKALTDDEITDVWERYDEGIGTRRDLVNRIAKRLGVNPKEDAG